MPTPPRSAGSATSTTAPDAQAKQDVQKKTKKRPPVRRFRPYAPLDHAARVYAGLAMSLVVPVTITMAIIIWAVQVLQPVDNTYPVGNSVSSAPVAAVDPAFVVVKESPDKSTGEKIGGALVNMIIVVCAITVITFVMVLLYKYGCHKVLYAWLGLSAALVFFFLAGLFFDLVATRYQIPYDYVVFALLVWNFGVVGMLSVFYMAHPMVSQGYLVVVSVIVTWGLTQTPEWTTWMILVGVAIYDILAVLCPNGPLRLLVEAAQERQDPIPGFVYNSDSGPSVELDERKPAPRKPMVPENRGKKQPGAHEAATPSSAPATSSKIDDGDDDFLPSVRPVNPMAALEQQQQPQSARADPPPLPPARGSQPDLDDLLGSPATATYGATASEAVVGSAAAADDGGTRTSSTWHPSPRSDGAVVFEGKPKVEGDASSSASEQKGKEERNKTDDGKQKQKKKGKGGAESSDEEEDPFEAAHFARPFQLGLGDFVFYSLLCGRAALSSPTSQTPWLVCYISIISGMGATLASLLFLRGKVPALPALPFSIFAATIAFFITRYVTTPYWDMLALNALVS